MFSVSIGGRRSGNMLLCKQLPMCTMSLVARVIWQFLLLCRTVRVDYWEQIAETPTMQSHKRLPNVTHCVCQKALHSSKSHTLSVNYTSRQSPSSHNFGAISHERTLLQLYLFRKCALCSTRSCLTLSLREQNAGVRESSDITTPLNHYTFFISTYQLSNLDHVITQ